MFFRFFHFRPNFVLIFFFFLVPSFGKFRVKYFYFFFRPYNHTPIVSAKMVKLLILTRWTRPPTHNVSLGTPPKGFSAFWTWRIVLKKWKYSVIVLECSKNDLRKVYLHFIRLVKNHENYQFLIIWKTPKFLFFNKFIRL